MGVKSHQKKSTWLIMLLMVLSLSTNHVFCSSADEHQAIVEEQEVELAKVAEIKPDLDQAESKDGQGTEIVKQIRRLNHDGSYTVGYEADDGTFKIESRDVLGNIKGTYGYVDENGLIKRVSYSGNNGTDLKSPEEVEEEEVAAPVPTLEIPQNRTFHASTTRRPTSLAYLTNPPPTRSSVIQPIPRKRIIGPYPTERPDKLVTSPTVIYATSVTTPKPTILIRPTALPQTVARTQEKLESSPNTNIRVTTNRETSTSKPVTEEVLEKAPERKPTRGNHLRRQLSQERNPSDRERDERFSTQQQILYSQSADEERGQIYGGGGSVTARPIFSTTHSPRASGIVLAARQRVAALQNSLNTNTQTTTTTEKIYVKPPTRRQQLDPTESNFEKSTEPTSENSYHTPTAGPIVQIPPNREVQAAADDEPVVYRRNPIPPPNFEQRFRQRGQFIPATTQRGPYRLPAQTPRPQYDEQFTDDNLIIPPNVPPFRGQAQRPRQNFVRQYSPQQEQDDQGYEQQSYQLPYAQNPYRQSPYGPGPGQPYLPERPLTTRDFERLLQLLVIKHQQLQQARLGYFGGNNFLGGGGGGGYLNTASPYLGYQQIPRPPVYDPALYDPRNPYYRAPSLLGRYNEPEGAYQAQNQLPDQASPYDGQRLVPRKKQYNPRYFGAASAYPDQEYSQNQIIDQSQNDPDYLPGNVREDLLYRMLMLAIQGEQPQIGGLRNNQVIPLASNLEPSTTTAGNTTPYNKKPIRSVQILGEEN